MNINRTDIILCEDSPDDAELTIRELKKSGIHNSLAHIRDGEEALRFIFCEGPYSGFTMTEVPKLILPDLKMPKVDGPDVLRRIKSDARTKTIPVVLLTSSREDRNMQDCYKLGVSSCVVKPVAFDGFVKTVAGPGLYRLLRNQPPTRF